MTLQTTLPPRPIAIVLGSGDIGSAVALALHEAGYAVVLADEADPSWHRRGMAFTDAWYVGTAELLGVTACFCASQKSIPSVLARRMIAATTWSWPGVASELTPVVLVDARGRKRRGAEILLGRIPLTIGIGPGFVEGGNVDVVLGSAADTRTPRAEDEAPLQPDLRARGGPACGTDCTVEAVRQGRFMTERRIGEEVRPGQIVGGFGNEAVAAPAGGVLLGLAARGARIEPGDTLVEVDPDGVAHRCFGVREGLRRLAATVMSALTDRQRLARGAQFRTDAGGPRKTVCDAALR